MIATAPAVRAQLSRQVAHWSLAASVLGEDPRIADPSGFLRLEHYLGVAVRDVVGGCVDRLGRQAGVLRAELRAAETPAEMDRLHAELVVFRERYFRAETVLEFFGEAVSSRANERLGGYLRACDLLASRSIERVLGPLGKPTPPVLTYVDKGLGASILKAGLRLWDGRSINPVAAIRLVRHGLCLPTSMFHECGHQVAHSLEWLPEVTASLQRGLSDASPELAAAWSGWASETVADAFAFANMGFAAVGALHDVLSGSAASVFRIGADDPHPIGYLRVLLGTTMCTRFFGKGPWDDLASAWRASYERDVPGATLREFLRRAELMLPRVCEIVLEQPMRALGGKALSTIVDPTRVKPEALRDLEGAVGDDRTLSDHRLHEECVRLLALSGLVATTEPERAREIYEAQERWMLRLGGLSGAA